MDEDLTRKPLIMRDKVVGLRLDFLCFGSLKQVAEVQRCTMTDVLLDVQRAGLRSLMLNDYNHPLVFQYVDNCRTEAALWKLFEGFCKAKNNQPGYEFAERGDKYILKTPATFKEKKPKDKK